MLCVLIALAYLYLSAGIRIYSTWRQAHGDSAKVATLEHEHTLLPAPARSAGPARHGRSGGAPAGHDDAGEQPYIVSGLPNN